jgi:SAM-dependent methyltransferase
MNGFDRQKIKAAYNNFAEHRERVEIEPWKFEERERFLALLNRENRISLLEIGAGTGRDSWYFQRQGLEVTSIDFSEEMVRLCKEKGLNAAIMDFTHLDFPRETFDAVYALNCLLHVPKAKLDEVLQRIRDVLRSGGVFFLGLYGGQDREGIWEHDSYEPKRFFSMYEDQAILAIVRRWFVVEDFHTVDMGPNKPHFQSMILRKF